MWANVSLHSTYVYVQYVCASECVFKMHNNILSLPVCCGDKGWLLRLQPQWQ